MGNTLNLKQVIIATMSTSDTSSEENFDMLREAADGQFINDSMFTSNRTDSGTHKEHNGTSKQKKPASLRPQLDTEQQFNELHVTPEFQAFVAKHLVRIIDRQLDEFHVDGSTCFGQNGDTEGQPSGGIRLFGSSSSYLSAETTAPHKKEKRRGVQEEDEHELEKCKTVAVSPEWVISRKNTFGWEKPNKGELLVVDASGKVIDHKGAKIKVKTNSWGVLDNTVHIDVKASAVNITSLKKRKNVEGNNKERKKTKSRK
ncbi:uncharacterized protein LOC110826880 isoform X2 [Zootermopsis nevadensis]|uniref:Protein CUSTOS n=1 Tax=Zootermopsis nevadensis TaxID=136037 RepID=A0A067RHE0_ZOONE|nr:uncharacterized protein LOC110826880 isoform X2 [Zootermopsis nevadensis]KDR22463.1 hypothetical protein L798_01459 [Zootermopsis nevadensis]